MTVPSEEERFLAIFGKLSEAVAVLSDTEGLLDGLVTDLRARLSEPEILETYGLLFLLAGRVTGARQVLDVSDLLIDESAEEGFQGDETPN